MIKGELTVVSNRVEAIQEGQQQAQVKLDWIMRYCLKAINCVWLLVQCMLENNLICSS